MKAVILAGGIGFRMGELTKELPKPMLKIGNIPILEHQINLLRQYGIHDIIIIVNYLKDSIIDYFGNGEKHKVKISYFEEIVPLGTVGGIKEIEEQLQEDFLVFYGDVMINMHLGRFIDFHKKHNSDCTLVLHPNDHPFDSDLVETDETRRVIDFHPKPHPEGMLYKNLVNAGAYLMTPAIFPFIEKGKKADFGRHIFPAIYNKIKMFGYNTTEYLKDMGTPERLQEVEKSYTSGRIARSNYEFKQKAIFLDRDGVLNEERGLFKEPENLEVFDFVPEAVKMINRSDFKAIVVTNQPGIAKNILSLTELSKIHKKLETILGNKGAKIDELYFCPHHPDKGFPGERLEYKIDCNCRKPKPGMLLKAAEEFNIDLPKSYMIGDSGRDILAGLFAGCNTVGVMTGYGVKKTSILPDFFFPNMSEAVDFITSAPHEESFQKILSLVESSAKKPFIIGVGGNAKSGKSNFSSYIKMRFREEGKKTLKVLLDNWIIPEGSRSKEMNVFNRFRLSDIIKDITRLVNGLPISLCSYAHHPERGISLLEYDPFGCDIIIIEGVVALSCDELRKLYHTSIYLSANEKRRKVRIDEYYLWKGKTPEEIDHIYQSRLSDEYEIIEKDRKFADLVIET